MAMNLAERETNIVLNDAEDVATIYTAQPALMRRLGRNPLAKLIETHRDERGRTTGMEFELPKRAITIKSRVGRDVTRPLTEAQQEARRKFTAKARERRTLVGTGR